MPIFVELVYMYKYRYRTATKIQTDTLIRTDTIPRPYPVVKEVNGKTGFDWFQIWAGRIALVILAGGIILALIGWRWIKF
ncbi:hypothetical protein [Viscerimonas tarda]